MPQSTASSRAKSEQRLRALLLQLFNVSELRRFLYLMPGGEEVGNAISWQTSPAEVSYQFVSALLRRGMLDGEFFNALISERPRMRLQIKEVAQAFGISTTTTEPVVPPDPTRTTPTPPTGEVLSINKIFRTAGVPAINFVAPAQLPEIEIRLTFMGEGLVVEGASGVGKTTAVRHALQETQGADCDVLEERGALIWLSSKDPQDQQRLTRVLDAGARALTGHLVIDDFHWLPRALQDRVADLIKLVADAGRDIAKIVLIGINPIGDSLVRNFRDLTGRFAVIKMNQQPDEKIEELIRKGEAAANIVFEKRTQLVRAARSSFYTTQLLCQHIALMEGVRETLPELRVLTTPIKDVINRVRDQLKFKYHARLLTFASYDASPVPRGATFALLWLLSKDFDDGVSLMTAKQRYPALRLALDWLLESNLTGLFQAHPVLSELLFYNRDAGILSTEDPQLDFYLNTLSWPALARDSGNIHVAWEQDSTPNFTAQPVQPDTEPVSTAPEQPRAWVLHISDLHIDSTDRALQLYDQLREDLSGEFDIDRLTAVVVSGDIVNYGTPVEYQSAAHFFRDLKRGFSLGPREIVLVPGNHDLDWSIAKSKYALTRRGDWSGPADDTWYVEHGDIIEVASIQDLQERFQAFASFHEDVCGESYSMEPERQVTLSHFPDAKLLFLGLNSSWAIDHHHTDRADINARALGRALERIDREPSYQGSLRIAVWHHPITSGDDDRIRDTGFLERLAKADFRLALHGHLHKAMEVHYRYDMSPGGRRMELLGAGSFGAPVRELNPGYPLQYQLLEFSGAELTVHTRRREVVNGAWKPDARWTTGKGKDPLPRYTIHL